MQKLHLVGFTTDQSGLILSARRGARSGGYSLVLDDALATAVEELRARQEEEAAAGASGRGDRAESRLPIGEIQTRLRRGKSVKDVAKEAGVEPEWVERFAAPVFAEQAEVISRVQSHFYKRQRLGPSGLRIGDAVRRNLAERGVQMAPDEFSSAWKTLQRPDGRWIVTFSFPYRGANRQLKFEVRPSGDIVGADQLTAQLAYVTPPKRPAVRPKPTPTSSDEPPKRAIVSSGFRADPVVKAVSRPGKERERAAAAMTKAAAKRAAEAERAAARKAREREQMLARREREERQEAQRREREVAAKRREAAAKARLAAAEKAERERAAAAVAAAKQAERDAARRAARLKVKSESRTVAAKRSAAAKASRASTARKAAAARSKPGAPEPLRPATRPTAAQRVDAPPPPGRAPERSNAAPAAGAARSTRSAAPAARRAPSRPAAAERPAERSAQRPAQRPVDRRGAVSSPAAARAGSAPAARADRATPAPSPSPAPDAPRPQFRPGLADPAGDDTMATPAVRPARRSPPNGTAAPRPPGARRTRPLRAT